MAQNVPFKSPHKLSYNLIMIRQVVSVEVFRFFPEFFYTVEIFPISYFILSWSLKSLLYMTTLLINPFLRQ